MRAGGILFFLGCMVTQQPFYMWLLIGADSYGPNFDFLYLLDVNNDKGVV